MKKKKNSLLVLLGIVFTIASVGFMQVNADYFDVLKNVEIYGAAIKEVELNYVDDVDHDQLMVTGAKTILSALDPYSDLIPEEDIEAYKTSTTGEYGGIGAVIGKKKDDCLILMPYEGYPADDAGLAIGDKILAIDGQSLDQLSTHEISKLLKGKAGTAVKLKISTPIEDKEITLTREKITISNVPYAGIVADSIGYIKLTEFTTDASDEITKSIISLRNQGLNGLILDLRNNPGGLLDEAVNVSNIFIDQGSTIVVTKGRDDDGDRNYLAPSPALDTETPLVVLVNGMSASASEIVSGVIQDYDRGVLVGRKTFGKGLVQSTRPLPYNAQLKLTTAKYYIPSGRCIQAIDYSTRKDDGTVDKIPDSLKVAFKTKVGRTVFDGAGIDPDVKVGDRTYDEILIHLVNSDMVFDFATKYKSTHPEISSARAFTVSEELYQQFISYLKAENFTYESSTEKYITEVRKSIKEDSSVYAIEDELKTILDLINEKKEKALENNKEDIKLILREEIVSRYFLQRGIVETSFAYDPDIKEAINVLSDKRNYQALLKN